MATTDMLPAYIAKLAPAEYDRQRVARRKERIVAALTKGGVKIVDSFESGSFSHGTAIKDNADVDLMVWTDLGQQPALPSSALDRFKSALINELPFLSYLTVRTSTPTVTVTFFSPPHFEVIPAFYNREVNGKLVYDIAGQRDEWIQSAPAAHNALVNAENVRLKKRLKPLIRLAKAWKYHVKAPVSSFYLEMRATELARTKVNILYCVDFPSVFRSIIARDVADMNDPGRVAGRIPACSSDDKRRQVKALMEKALDDLDSAETHRQANHSYRYCWKMQSVFGDDFPCP